MDTLKSIGSCLAAIGVLVGGSENSCAFPLRFASVRAPLHCVLRTPCAEVQWTDTFVTISSPIWSGIARLETRTFRSSFGTPTGEKNFYEYRVDLTQTITIADATCITDLSIDFGPVIKLQFDGGGPLDSGYVIQGTTSAIGLSAVDQTNGVITFTFSQPVCAGATPGTGQASRVFGIASPFPPKAIVAHVNVPGLDSIAVATRGPQQSRR